MGFELQFAPVLAEIPLLMQGLWLTIELSLSAICLGGSVGLLAAIAHNVAMPRR